MLDSFFWLSERVKTYRVLIGEDHWQEDGFEDRWNVINDAYENIITNSELFLSDLESAFEEIKANR